MAIHGYAECLQKPREIARLTEDNQRLKQKVRYQDRQGTEGFFGSATPCAKLPVKANTPPAKVPPQKGARPGPLGAGRQAFDARQAGEVVDIAAEVGYPCPDCDVSLEDTITQGRVVCENHPVKAERLLYRLPKKYCPRCRRIFQPRAPAGRPKSLYGNQLMATAATMHYLHGIPLGRICEQMGLGAGSLVEIVHRLARLFAGMPARLVMEYRQTPVKHAVETRCRTNGHNGDTWPFASPQLSVFRFRKTRAASVPKERFGTAPLPGCLVVDR